MNAIVGFANLIGDEKMDVNERNDCISQINLNSIELLQIIDNMIDASLLQCGDLRIYNKECYLNDLLDDIYDSFKKLIDVRQKKLNLIVSRGEDNDYSIVTDHKRLRQVFNNLISNSIKFTNSGYVEFGYERYDRNKVRFFVKDTGSGLGSFSEDDLFKPFYSRLYSDNDNINKGAGLGLAVSKGLVELMGGELWPESVPGTGTYFYFTLPTEKNTFLKSRLKRLNSIIKRNIASFF